MGVVLVVTASIYQRRVVDKGWVPGAKRDALLAEQAEAEATAEKEPTKA